MAHHNNNNIVTDEFGGDDDDAFWDDFDVDAVVATAATSTATAASNTTSSSSSRSFVAANTSVPPPPSKRAKVSLSPNNNNNNTGTNTGTDGGDNNHNHNNHNKNKNNNNNSSLHDCLERYFGFRQFRPGQEEAIRAVLRGQDVAIFWATGSGKSLAFCLPALYDDDDTTTTTTTPTPTRMALVVSPLISLMQDQVHKLNGLVPSSSSYPSSSSSSSSSSRSSSNAKNEQQLQPQLLATYLGSAQMDASMERRVLQGEFRIVFCTPEKLQSAGFLDSLAAHSNNKQQHHLKLCLIAIDESHCVSDWGHDFRPEYRQAGKTLRSHPQLHKVPLMALTATAVPRIQNDIIETLQMRNVFISKKSFDRPNLSIRVVPKEGGGSGFGGGGGALRSAMEPLVQTLLREEQQQLQKVASTIVYASTKAQVEEIASFLQQRLQASQSKVQVQYYHGDLSSTTRHATHISFLTGQTAVVVATIAFGMGIDKPDTRRVIHFGPPQTVEEYYQQIGRAGRDGLPAECILYASRSDFDKYHSDFYIGQLSNKPQARDAVLKSTQALKDFAMNKEKCRRRALLEFFDEVPTYEHCGTCDVCQARQEFGDDTRRDFGPVARLLLECVAGLRDQGMTTVLQVLGGKIVEDYRYSKINTPTTLKASLGAKMAALDKKVTQQQIKELVTALIQAKYLAEVTKKAETGGYTRTWTVFQVSKSGFAALSNPNNSPIMLPVPDSIREAERQDEARRQRVLQQLQDSGIALEKLPQKEVEKGDGEVIQAYLTWNRRIDSLQKNEKHERLSQVQELLQLLEEWRSDAATRLQMAPASVLAEHVLYSVAYTAQSLPSGIKMTSKDLEQSGARSREIQSLADVINSWLDRYQQQQQPAPASSSSGALSSSEDPVLCLPAGSRHAPNGKWEFAVYKPQKKTGLASWESSYIRFTKGESPTTIAMSPDKGRPLAVTTVLGHIQEAFLQGRPVDLQKLGSYYPSLLTQSQWMRLGEAEAEMGMNVAGDPTISGTNGGNYTMTDLLQPIMGIEFVETPYDQRSDAEKQRFSQWCEALKWYQLLKRGGITPQFEQEARKVDV